MGKEGKLVLSFSAVFVLFKSSDFKIVSQKYEVNVSLTSQDIYNVIKLDIEVDWSGKTFLPLSTQSFLLINSDKEKM